MGHFVVAAKNKLSEMEIGARIDESDFASLTEDGTFVQLKYNEEDDNQKAEKYNVKPGIWTIIKTMTGLKLEETSFVTDRILEEFVHTKELEDKIDCFMRNIHVYAEEGIEVAARKILVFGSPGSGKTTSINKVLNKYAADKKTAVLVWTTDKFEAYQVKDLIKSFNYVDGCEKLILVVEDIGGTEIEQSRMRSDASLLSLLDNQEKTFTCPYLIIATTNYPENLMGNLTNRPGRFDDKIKMNNPPTEMRVKLFQFFAKGRETPEAIALIQDKKASVLSPAHLKDVIIRSRIYERPMDEIIKEMIKEVEQYTKGFADNKGSMGIGND